MWKFCIIDTHTESVKIEEGIRLVGETEVKDCFTEEVSFAWKWPDALGEQGLCIFTM